MKNKFVTFFQISFDSPSPPPPKASEGMINHHRREHRHSTNRSWHDKIMNPKFHTPFLGSLPENCVLKVSCYTYTIY